MANKPKTDDNDPAASDTQEVTEAAQVAATVKKNGGGDVAVLEAVRAKLAGNRAHRIASADIDRAAKHAKANLWGLSTDRGAKMVRNADTAYAEAVETARETFNRLFDEFRLDNGFIGMVGRDERRIIFGRKVTRIAEQAARLFKIAEEAGDTDILDAFGRNWNVENVLAVVNVVDKAQAEANKAEAEAALATDPSAEAVSAEAAPNAENQDVAA